MRGLWNLIYVKEQKKGDCQLKNIVNISDICDVTYIFKIDYLILITRFYSSINYLFNWEKNWQSGLNEIFPPTLKKLMNFWLKIN